MIAFLGGSETYAELADFRASAVGSFSNIFFFNFPDPEVAGRGDFSLSTGSDVMFSNGQLTFDQLETILPEGVALSSVFKNGTDISTEEDGRNIVITTAYDTGNDVPKKLDLNIRLVKNDWVDP